jgi:hypothetical protein
MANVSNVVDFNGSGYAGGYTSGFAPAAGSSFVGNVSGHGPVVSHRVNEQTGFEDVVVRVPRREQVRVVQGPPQIQNQVVPGPVVERVQRNVIPGPVVEQKVVVPGPVVERVETVPGPVRVVERIEKVLVEQPFERIERVVIPGPEVVKEVKVEIPGPIVEKVVDVQVPGEEIIKRVEVKVPVDGPVKERIQRVDVPRDVVREVIQTRPIARHVPVPVYTPGPVREVVVRVRDEHLVRENLKLLRIRDRELAKLNRRRYDQVYDSLRDEARRLKSQLRGAQGGYFQPTATLEAPQHNFGNYFQFPQQQQFGNFGTIGGYAAAPVSAPVSYDAAPQQYYSGDVTSAPITTDAGYTAAPATQYADAGYAAAPATQYVGAQPAYGYGAVAPVSYGGYGAPQQFGGFY